MRLEDALAPWLQEQRWLAGKGRILRDLSVVADTEGVAGYPALRHLIVLVSHGASADHYQIFIGLRHDLPGWLEHARIGTLDDGRHVYDALHDPELTRVLLRAIAGNETIQTLAFHRARGAEIDTSLDSIVLPRAQSNTSLVYGEESILKVFRRVFAGPNPDLEVTSALNRLGSTHIAQPYGSIEAVVGRGGPTLAILSTSLRTATAGWTLAATSVRDLYARDLYENDAVSAADAGGDFSGEAQRLGAATAEVHRNLAEAFGTEELLPDALHEMAEQMYRRLDLAAAGVPALAPYAELIGHVSSVLGEVKDPV